MGDLERRAESYRIALGRIIDLCGDADYCRQDILEIASDALAEDMQADNICAELSDLESLKESER